MFSHSSLHNKRKKMLAGSLLCILLSLFTACGTATESEIMEPLVSLTAQNETVTESPVEEQSAANQPIESPPAEELSVEYPSTEERLDLIMVGDVLLHTPVEESALQEDGSYDFTAIFSHTGDKIRAADLSIVNQEVIIGGEELGISGYPAFNAPYAIGDALAAAGFDVVCHGTNHALDKGRRGLLNCLAFWKQEYPDMGILGIHDSAQSQDTIYVYEENGIRVAILNYTYGTNGIELPADMPYAVDLLKEEKVVSDIRKAEKEADFTIVCPHWGTEYLLGISSYQEKWTKLFLDNGVDLVLGTHPHVIEPIEWVTEEDTGHKMLVYYSLGNFVNWTSSSGEGIANRMIGGMAQVSLMRNEKDEVVIDTYGIEPLVSHLQEGTDGVTVYPLSEYTQELAEQNLIIRQDSAFSLLYCEQLCEDVWGELYTMP